MQETIHHIHSSLPTLFSLLCKLLGEVLNEVTNTLFPNAHSNCSGGKISCYCYRECLKYLYSICAFEFIFGLENPY
jgi:hypothetical protein